MLEAVPSSIKNGCKRRRTHFVRVMNSLLLFLIFYGATCGLVHSHAVYRPPVSTSGTVLDDGRNADSATRLLPSGVNCLLCQFHQQLSHGLFHTTPFAQQPPASVTSQLHANFNDYSAPHKSSRGRAPPLASLL